MAYGSRALLLHRGETQAVGPISEVLTAAHLQQVYGMDVKEWMQTMLCQWDKL